MNVITVWSTEMILWILWSDAHIFGRLFCAIARAIWMDDSFSWTFARGRFSLGVRLPMYFSSLPLTHRIVQEMERHDRHLAE